MSLHSKLRVNWWVWMAIVVPWVLYLLLRRYEDKAGDIWSDWSWMMYNASHRQWSYCREVLLWDVLPPLVISWIAQFFIVMAWQRWRGGIGRQTAEV